MATAKKPSSSKKVTPFSVSNQTAAFTPPKITPAASAKSSAGKHEARVRKNTIW